MTAAAAEWARCRHLIVAALATSPGLETIADVEARVASGQYQFWPGRGSAAITEIQTYPARRILMVLHGGGDLRELLDEMEPRFCAFARAFDCTAIAGVGRRGWERASARHGYQFAMVTMMKEISR